MLLLLTCTDELYNNWYLEVVIHLNSCSVPYPKFVEKLIIQVANTNAEKQKISEKNQGM